MIILQMCGPVTVWKITLTSYSRRLVIGTEAELNCRWRGCPIPVSFPWSELVSVGKDIRPPKTR